MSNAGFSGVINQTADPHTPLAKLIRCDWRLAKKKVAEGGKNGFAG